MIPDRMEPKGLARDTPAYDDIFARKMARHRAATGSDKLLAALLKANGVPVADIPPVPRRIPPAPRGRPVGTFKRRRTNKDVLHIQSEVAKHFGVVAIELCGPKKTDELVRPRQMAMFLCRALTKASYPDLGLHFNRDHTTVIYGVRKVEERVASFDLETIRALKTLTDKLRVSEVVE